MGWFDEQIRQRKLEDDRIFRESLKGAAGAVLGLERVFRDDDRVLAGSALEKILRFYHLKYNEKYKLKYHVYNLNIYNGL